MNQEWKEEANIIPADGASGDYFGYDVALSVDTALIEYPLDDYMGTNSGSVYFFVRRDNETWEEIHKLTPTDWGAYDEFGYSVAPSGTIRGALIADIFMYTPILEGSGLIMARYFLRMVQLMTSLGVVLPFWGVFLGC